MRSAVFRIADTNAGCTFAVRVIPRAGRTAISGVRGQALLIRLAAAPADGAANDALIELLAGLLDRPRRDVSIVAGHTSRDKRLAVAGMSAGAAADALSAILPA
jgi:uncharacterized protein